MKERPILFSGPMVRAILDGKKTMTRRVMKLPISHNDIESVSDITGGWWCGFNSNDTSYLLTCPYGQPGDRLWVRETWRSTRVDKTPAPCIYRADGGKTPYGKPWIPSIHMPRWASRITLEITGVWVERVQEISEENAKAEGVTPSIVGQDLDHLRYRAGFQSLWDSINAKRGYGWDANPWVWVLTFRRV